MCQCKELNAVIAGPGELTFFNDAWMQAKDSNERITNIGRQQIEKNKTISDEKFENQNKFKKDFVQTRLATRDRWTRM